MSQRFVCDGPSEDTICLFEVKEEPLDAPSVNDIDNIKHDSPCASIKDEIYIKEESLENIDESALNFEMRSSDLHNLNSSNSEVCGIKNSIYILLY